MKDNKKSNQMHCYLSVISIMFLAFIQVARADVTTSNMSTSNTIVTNKVPTNINSSKSSVSTPIDSPVVDKMSFERYLSQLKKEALDSGIKQSVINDAFMNVKFKPKVVSSDKKQPEKVQTLDQYLPKAVPKWKVDKAKKLYKQHLSQLRKISDEYGVQPQFIVALWGVESGFGSYMGKSRVVDSLITLSYDGRREAFFKKELMAALQILQQQNMPASQLLGSWAGAMGQCQFMPSSYLAYAVDGNLDGKKDIWKSLPDVWASTANYLKSFGWDSKYTWGREVKLTKPLDHAYFGREQDKAKTLSQWQALGVRTVYDQKLPSVEIQAWLIQPDDEHGRTYLIYNNYQVLMKWNRSHYFALAVSTLADKIVSN